MADEPLIFRPRARELPPTDTGKLTASLNDDQARAATFGNAALPALAGAGPGTTPTLLYRVAARIFDEEADAVIGRVCRSEGGAPGCLRTILWARDESKARPSLRLPLDKYIAPLDQTGRGENVMPLLCQEACNLLVAEMRKAVKEDSSSETE